ncbi:MAG: class I SAM-dependent methyltransferase [Paracoccaceae bacterium]|nr:class I SAM-dependent methyltransferase [Paracoccaceae bacterium]
MKHESIPAGKGDRYYGRTARNYEVRRRKQPWWHVEQHEMQALLETLPKKLKVLDVPFGTGRFAPYYIERGYKVTGLDSSDEMLGQAGVILGDMIKKCELVRGQSIDLPFEDGAFDLLVSTRFLRDIISFADARRSLDEFARVTKRFAIIQLGHAIEGGTTPEDHVTMRSEMSAEGIDKLLADHGFTVTEKRLVKYDEDENSEIHHILCERT